MARTSESERAHNREIENEMIRLPEKGGEPPRPAIEPPTSSEHPSPAKKLVRRAETGQAKQTEVETLKASSKSVRGKLQDPQTPQVDMGQGSLEEQLSGSEPHHRIKPRPDR